MPFYPNLKSRPNDSAILKHKKQRVIANLKLLKSKLLEHIQNSRGQINSTKTVKIATWNLREFGKNNYGGRSFEEIYYIAEIISAFDLIALQEIRGDLTEFNSLKKILGPQWDFLATDVTDSRAGNDERMVFLFNRDVIQFRNIAGELTLKEGQKVKASFGERIKLEDGLILNLNNQDLSGIYDASTQSKNGVITLADDLEISLPANCNLKIPQGSYLTLKKGTQIQRPATGKAQVQIPAGLVEGKDYALRFPENSFDDSLKQFARTPFLISFQSGWLKLNLCTVHIYYGDDSNINKMTQRKDEIELLTEALAHKAENEFKQDKESFLGVLGDFNIIGKGHPTMQALESNDFLIPEKLKEIPKGSNVARDKAYDQIAFWMPGNRITNYSKLEVVGANIFDFYDYVFTEADEQAYRNEGQGVNGLKPTSSYKTWRTYKMSDHLPMWVEIKNDFSDEYLKYIESQYD